MWLVKRNATVSRASGRVKCAATMENSIAVLQNIQRKLPYDSANYFWVYLHKN